MMEPSSDYHQGGIVSADSIGGAGVSGHGKGVLTESNERVLRLVENGNDDGGIDMRLNSEVSGSGFVDDENIRANVVGTRLDSNVESRFDLERGKGKVSEVCEFDAIDLVVDLDHCSRKGIDHDGNEIDAGFGTNGIKSSEKGAIDVELTEKEGEYEVADLVWAKVKSHPWWPGQIFDPLASTDEARKYFKKDGFLIAYFGDQTFAWNESVNIKPFRMNFCKMAKQSNAEAFCRAVDHALHEAARRVEFGLACLCLSEEVYGKIKSQIIVNAGIREESSRVDGGDRFSTVASLKPAKVVQCVQDLAKAPFGTSILEGSTVRAQLLAFNRWKGYYQLRTDQVFDGSENKIDNDNSGFHSTRGEEVTKKGKLNARGSVPRKRKHVFDGGLSPSKKVRCLSDLMSNGSPSVSDGEYKTKKPGRKRKTIESNDSRVGIQCQTADEFLSQIRVAAGNPMEEQHNLDSLVRFSSEFRNYRLETSSQLREDKNDVDQTEEIAHHSEATEAAGFTGIEDSYWTDRIIQIDPDEQIFSERKSVIFDSNLKPNKENSATALILKFTSLDSVPSVTNLNEIFSRYGPLRELETEVLKKNNCAKVVFKRRSDAETAFSSTGKFSMFGPALVSYCLDYSPTPHKTPTAGRKRSKKSVKSAKEMQFEN